MTRCIQLGRITIQGPATDIRAGFGTIASRFGPVRGRLMGGALSEENRPDRLAGKVLEGGALVDGKREAGGA